MKRLSKEPPAARIACEIYEGAHSDAGPDWDLEDAVDFVLEHMATGDFGWYTGPAGRTVPKSRFSCDDVETERVVRDALSRYYLNPED